jgi:hypothetical protein
LQNTRKIKIHEKKKEVKRPIEQQLEQKRGRKEIGGRASSSR